MTSNSVARELRLPASVLSLREHEDDVCIADQCFLIIQSGDSFTLAREPSLRKSTSNAIHSTPKSDLGMQGALTESHPNNSMDAMDAPRDRQVRFTTPLRSSGGECVAEGPSSIPKQLSSLPGSPTSVAAISPRSSKLVLRTNKNTPKERASLYTYSKHKIRNCNDFYGVFHIDREDPLHSQPEEILGDTAKQARPGDIMVWNDPLGTGGAFDFEEESDGKGALLDHEQQTYSLELTRTPPDGIDGTDQIEEGIVGSESKTFGTPAYFPFQSAKDAEAPKVGRPNGSMGMLDGGYSLRDTLKWDPEAYKAVQVQLRVIARRHFDRRKTMKNQKPAVIEAYIKESVHVFPFLTSYPEQWPAVDFARQYLKSSIDQARKKGRHHGSVTHRTTGKTVRGLYITSKKRRKHKLDDGLRRLENIQREDQDRMQDIEEEIMNAALGDDSRAMDVEYDLLFATDEHTADGRADDREEPSQIDEEEDESTDEVRLYLNAWQEEFQARSTEFSRKKEGLETRLDEMTVADETLERERLSLMDVATRELSLVHELVQSAWDRKMTNRRGPDVPKVYSTIPRLDVSLAGEAVFVCLVTVVVLHLILGLSRSASGFAFAMMRLMVRQACASYVRSCGLENAQNYPILLEMLGGQQAWPGDVRTAMKMLEVDPDTTTYACCPKCRFLHEADEKGKYKSACDFKPFPKSAPCGGVAHETPGIVGQMENVQRTWKDALNEWRDMFHAVGARGLLWADKKPFLDAPVGQLRLALAMNIDWFNPFGRKQAGKTNVYLAGILPGPSEPDFDQLNHLLQPLVDGLLRLWRVVSTNSRMTIAIVMVNGKSTIQ
ncbi:hypothetical protein BKA70DRAFT_1242576 [Coprinopsis sp. MPI-PUGE-AT-0042]|nr:hypothetical protein BKA70DRAFT_1242576 [Coprinopsis sp. MPI-PUGE-AT-0042]